MNAREARVHAYIVACLLWATAAVIAFSGSGYRSIFGPLKGTDFIQFYTVAHLDRASAPALLYNEPELHHLQTTLVPESAPDHYLIMYPPHLALLFRPIAALSYGAAALVWTAVTILGYAICVWLAWRPVSAVLRDRGLLIAAAAAFPPFWYLVLFGQTTVVLLASFTLGWLALERNRPFWAGAAFGVLLLKPQFALLLVPIVLVCGEWRMMAGAATVVSAQVAAMIAAFGTSPLIQYVTMMRHPGNILGDAFLEPKPEQMHSFAALTNHLPSPLSTIVWSALAIAVSWKVVAVWRSRVPMFVRMAFLVLGSTLVNPHVYAYDATVLVLPLIWFAAWLWGEASDAHAAQSAFVGMTYILFVSLLAPTARLVPVQVSVICLGGIFVLMLRTIDDRRSGRTDALVRDASSPFLVA